MRLTLRTLLAYMDDILEPADQQDLSSKIEASDFATELIHRTRDTVRRLRLGAPPLEAGGGADIHEGDSNSDPNVVSEYLDNTLPPERVAEFERMCLEPGNIADQHLAEVASCHHVLTMVLGEPAEIDGTLRQRMYDIPSRLERGEKLRIEPGHITSQPQPQPAAPPVPSAAAATGPAAAAAPPAPPVSEEPEPKHELPDYLREAARSRRRVRYAAGAVAALLVVGLIVTWFVNVDDPVVPPEVAQTDTNRLQDEDLIADITTEEDPEPPADAAEGDAVAPAEGEAAPPFVPPSETTAEETREMPPLDEIQPDLEEGDESELASTTGDRQAQALADDSDAAPADSELPAEELGTEDLSDTGMAVVDPLLDNGADSQESASTDRQPPPLPEDSSPSLDARELPSVSELTSELTDSGPVDVPPPPAGDVSPAEDVSPAASETADTGAEAEPGELKPERIGMYAGNNDILLHYREDLGRWYRLPPRSPVETDETLLCLPKYRTHVVLADINTYLSGGTRVQIPLQPVPDSSQNAELELVIDFGRVLFNAGLSGSRLHLTVGNHQHEVSLDGSSSLAVEVKRLFSPGIDFENQEAPLEAIWYVTSGSIEWGELDGSTRTVEGPAMWRSVGGVDRAPEAIEELPAWIDREPLTDMERSARDMISEQLKPNQPVSLSLLELTDESGLGRREEIRTLATESSVFVGEFEPFVKAMNDREQNRYWESHIDKLRQAIALSPDVAGDLREAFEKLRGPEAADDLMEMIRGYDRQEVGTSPEEQQRGILVKLIGWLDQESLDYRVLAIHNLNEITGTQYIEGYRPAASASRRERSIRRIRELFESNELIRR